MGSGKLRQWERRATPSSDRLKPDPSPDPGSIAVPAADVDIDEALVRGLLAEQHPDLASLPLEEVESGWDNVIFRLGAQLAVRLPRRQAANRLLEHEQRWLPSFAERLCIPIPVPLRVGKPGGDYPFGWSVIPWLRGTACDIEPPTDDQGRELARFLERLHVAAPRDAPRSQVRGVPLESRAEVVEARLRRLEMKTSSITAGVRRTWRDALGADRNRNETWIHGDLHARNVLVDAGKFSGVIDWGDLAAGDKATDLASVWMLLPGARARREAIEAYPDKSPALWARARGWAVLFGALLLDTGLEGHARHARIGALTLMRIAEES